MNLWIRGVDFEYRSQSMAWSSIIVRIIGGIPGPIAVGAILDTTCVVWERTKCGKQGTCLVYSEASANVMLTIFLVTRFLNIIFNGLIIWIQRGKETTDNALPESGKQNTAFEE